MKIKLKIKTIVILAALITGMQTGAQVLTLKNGTSTIKVEGTSNLHDWEIISNNQSGKMNVTTEAGKLIDIKNLEVELNPETLKSGKGGMDKNTYKALKTDKHKKIVFRLKQVKGIEPAGAGVYKVNALASLNIAGFEKNIDITLLARLLGDKIQLSGDKKIKMTAFNIEPPKALMGTITTGDEVTIKFDSTFSK